MTYNIRSGRGVDGRLNLERIAKVIAAENPDVVALQEVDVRRRRTRHQDQALELAEQLGYHGAFVAAQSWAQGEYGNALLSRYPLADCRRVTLPKPARLPVETRCLMQCRIQWPKGEVQVWNTHLGLLAAERRTQVQLVLQHLSENGHAPLILCGDFNARPRAKELLGLFEHLTRVNSQRTFPGFLPVVHLDHVFHTPQLQVVSCFVPKSPLAKRASDHLPIVVDLDLV
jgi:endonuclease/exonuclease/phosphatase family metal-dependent hydrolase